MESTAAMPVRAPPPGDGAEGVRARYGLLARRHEARLRRVVGRILRDRSEVDDVVQQALLTGFRALAGFSGAAPLAAWLSRIAVHEALGRARWARRQEAAAAALGWRAGSSVDPEQEAGWREEAARVRAALERLPGRHREALVLAADGLGTAEIASALGIRQGAAKVRVHRARRALRALLGGAGPGTRPVPPRLALARDGDGGDGPPVARRGGLEAGAGVGG